MDAHSTYKQANMLYGAHMHRVGLSLNFNLNLNLNQNLNLNLKKQKLLNEASWVFSNFISSSFQNFESLERKYK